MLAQNKAVTHSSCDPDWGTPIELYTTLDAVGLDGNEFDFALDICADPSNHKHREWIGPGGLYDDALTYPDWSRYANRAVFMNPPWSRERGVSIVPFVVLARSVSELFNITFVCLYPAAIQTQWWVAHVWHGAHRIRFIPHRVNFDVSDAMLSHINNRRMRKGTDPIEKAWNAAGNTSVVVYDGSTPRPMKPDVDYWSYRDTREQELI